MNRRSLRIAALLACGLLLASCGDPGSTPTHAAGGSAADPSPSECGVPGYDGDGTPPPTELPEGCDGPAADGGPDEVVSNTPGTSDPDDGRIPPPVKPQPGQDDVRAVGWDSVKPLDEDTVKVKFWSGVEPCNVLDHIDVTYEPKTVTITLFEGSSPSDTDTACIEIALLKQTIVDLDEPLGGRKVVDGAR